PEQIHRQVRIATLLKFAALVAAHADDATGRTCWRAYPDLARGMAVTVETVRKCWRALERLGLAVQVEQSVCFRYEERMRLWRKGSKQRGMTPEYALVVPAAFAQALVTGEHPADLITPAREASGLGKDCAPAAKLSAALSALRAASPVLAVSRAIQEPAAALSAVPGASPAGNPLVVAEPAAASQPVDNPRKRSVTKLGKVDILGLPRSGTRPSYSSCLALVSLVPHGVKSTASRAHKRGGRTDSVRPGGTPARGAVHKCQAGRGSWFGPHRDIAVYLTSRVLWLRGVQPGRIAMQLRRFTAPELRRKWLPADFVTAFDAINRRQGRYSPGANLASSSKSDQGHAASATAGAVTSPPGLLRWYLEQIDPVNDHPRFELDLENERREAAIAARRAEAARARAAAIQLEASSVRDDWRAARRNLTVSRHGGQA
ncbi:hypothetical protein ABZS29_38390, partial [Kribbella sp. NPDC005582]|uniref:hypothetical protein n=1 Tax=Kribbella sp. NPDC005582 TaxID=3156893 RepID=UPI0033A28E85